jgi:hypothetical protein
VTPGQREQVADWLILVGAAALFASLFLTWSHQFSPAFLARWGSSSQLSGVPHDPTAWQAYSAADVMLALVALALVIVALVGSRAVRLGTLVVCGLAVAFTLRALDTPPTTGANIFDPSLSVARYFPNAPGAGVGETVALIALALAMTGLVLSFTAD